MTNIPLPRRRFLSLGSIAAMTMAVPRIAFAGTDSKRRFVFIIQRGAADGLDTVIPYGDADYARLRGDMAVDPATAAKLDGHFALHPSLVESAKLYASGEAAFLHAVATPYRDRSHFDAQNVLETGGAAPYATSDGWMNRLAMLLPGHDDRTAVALTPTVPMALRGSLSVSSIAPSALPQASDDLLLRVAKLYQGDPQLHQLWETAMASRGMAGNEGPRQDPASIGKLAGDLLAHADGPRLAMIETLGWDTHTAQRARLANQLKGLDAMVAAIKVSLGPLWSDTTVLIATEFGRTAAANGTGGTDHGTGSAAMLFGGSVRGGRVIADWPGLSHGALYEGRDVKPTIGLDALIAACAAEALSLDPQRVQRALFPRGLGGAALNGLVRT